MSGIFNMVVVQAVLIFGLEIWVMYPRNKRMLGIFKHWLIGPWTDPQTIIQMDRTWV